MTRKERIRGAYRALGDSATFYDGMITCSTVSGRAVSRAVWSIGPRENEAYLERAMAGVPEDFAGKLLEVPVGTGVLTMPLYQGLPQADVTCLDYSAEMMAAAQARARRAGLRNVAFMQGDVGALPFGDGQFDIVLSLNGFHAFPDKKAAYRETYRVLKPGGTFCGCFYVKGQNRRTDFFIDKLYRPLGYFTPPFETRQSLAARLKTMYRSVSVECFESIACFTCVK